MTADVHGKRTELPLLLRDVHEPVPFLDTTRIHVDAIVDEALSG